jgi:hypothetical protein
MRIANALFIGQGLVLLHYRIAQSSCAARGFDDAVEFDQDQIAGLLENIAAEFRNHRFDDFGQEFSQPGKALLLVTEEQPA